MITERQWRNQQVRRRMPAVCMGAQYVMKEHPARRLIYDKAFHVFMLLLSFVVAAMLPLLASPETQETFEDVSAGIQVTDSPRKVKAISYSYPSQIQTREQIYTREQLLRGKMLLIDEAHPLPSDVAPPNTMSIAMSGRGMVPVRNLQVKSGEQTIQALIKLFADLRQRGVSGLTVWEGTLSQAQQRTQQEDHARELMHRLSVDDAIQQTRMLFDEPGTGELLQEYTVELRFADQQPPAPQADAFEVSQQGQILLQTAWRYGFVRSFPHAQDRQAFRFRWVGNAHATAMTYLNLSLKEYLEWLHQKEVLTIEQNGAVKYVILCKPISGTHVSFRVPQNASCEASFDNMGYAVVACTVHN